jgi:hypothetical protein
MESDQALSKFIGDEAKKKGISGKDARKALKKLKGGGMMAQVAPQLHSQFMEMDPTMTPRDKLRMKMRKMQENRGSKQSKATSYERSKKEVKERQELEQLEKEQKKKQAVQRKRNHRKRIKELGKKLGPISHELYNECMGKIQSNNYTEDSKRNRDKNIIELYGQQQQFKEQINMDDLDDI